MALVNVENARKVAVIALVALCLTVGAYTIVARSGATAEHVASITSSVDNGGTGSRSILWHAALAMFRARPILGVGADNFEILLPRYGAPARVRTQANSLYLESLADGGILLGIATAFLAWLPPVLLIRARSSPFVLTMGIAGCALALHGLIDDVTFYTKVGQCWWLLAGIAAGLAPGRDEGVAA